MLPSRGTDGHSVHLLKTSLAPYGRGSYNRKHRASLLPIEGEMPKGQRGSYTQLDAVKVVAIAVRMVITTLRILPQRVLLLNVPIFV